MDHVNDYKPPKDSDKIDDETRRLHMEGCAPKPQIPAELIKRETEAEAKSAAFKMPARLPIREIKEEQLPHKQRIKKEKKAKKKSKKSKKRKHNSSESSSTSSNTGSD